MIESMQIYKAEVDFDEHYDLLSIRRPGFTTSYNLVAGNLVLDFNKNELVGIDIQGVKQWFVDLFGQPVKGKELVGVKFGFQEKRSLLQLFIEFKLPEKVLSKELTVPKFEPIPITAWERK